MLTATGNAAGAASPSPRSASAIRPARMSRPSSSLLGLSLGANLDELDARRAAARAFAGQERIDDLELARQTPPGGRRLRFARANRARLVGHRSRSSLQRSAPANRRGGEEEG